VPFIAVMPRTTSREKTRLIEFYGGRCHLVDDPLTVYEVSAALAAESGGHYLDQFTYAERATDWRGNNNIAESIYQQLRLERFPEPAWVVATAGTGGTSATIARYAHYMQYDTRVCVADPENSCFFDGWVHDNPGATSDSGSRIEGIGRPRMEPSFIPGAIDRMMKVPDAASIAAVRALERAIGRKAGGSTGTGLWSALKIVGEMVEQGRTGSVVTLMCDPGDRYLDKYYSDDWLAEQGLDIAPYAQAIEAFLATGHWPG
jgi:cysteine synthase A